MNIIITRGFGHRVLRNGLIESAPFDGEKFGVWERKTLDEMNLRGGDWAFVEGNLKRMAQIFPPDYKLPVSKQVSTPAPAATEAI